MGSTGAAGIIAAETLPRPQVALHWREAAAAGLGVTAICLLPLLVNDRFYFNDDYQSYFMPMFREIARLLTAGEFPLATPRIWFGGAIAGEYQYAVFHPVCLMLYVLLGAVSNLVVAATLYTALHVFLLGAGLFALCRHLGCAPRAAFIGALIGCTSSWLLYWGAGNWIPALVSEAWAVWALLFLLLAARESRYVPVAAIAVAFTLLSGWPFTNLALLVAAAVLGLTAAAARVGAAAVWRGLLSLGAGALLAMPALLTAAAYLAESGREPDAMPHAWGLTLNGLFSVGVPSAVEAWNFEGTLRGPSTLVQMLYASWLIPLALAVGGWRELLGKRRRTLAAVLMLAALFALGAMLPAIGHFRWFFRLLPFYHAALAILAALLLTHAAPGGGRWKGRYPLALALVFVPFIIPTALDLRTLVPSGFFALGIGLALVVALEAARHGQARFHAVLIAGHALVLLMVVFVWPRSLQVPVWDYPAAGPEPAGVSEAPRRLALYDSSLTEEPGRAYWSLIALGNTAAYLNAETINGYSPPVQRGLARLFCLDFKGGVCAEDAVARLFERRRGGLTLLDLAGIEAVAVDSEERAAQFAERAGETWRAAEREGPYTVFRRVEPLPGLLAVPPPPGLTVTELRSRGRGVFELDATPDFAGGELVLRRPWYPGVYARLKGRTLAVGTLERALPVIALPPGAEGRLVVGYWPKGLALGLVLSAVAAIFLLAASRLPVLLRPPWPVAMLWPRIMALCARWSGGSFPV